MNWNGPAAELQTVQTANGDTEWQLNSIELTNIKKQNNEQFRNHYIF